MNKNILFCVILITLCITKISSFNVKQNKLEDVNGGTPCVVCSVLVQMTEGLSIVYNQTVDQSLVKLCSYLPKGVFRTVCTQALKDYGQIIINGYILNIIYR